LAIELDGRRVAVPVVLAALRRAVELDPRLVSEARRQRPPRQRGASASMSALADRGLTAGDVALAIGSTYGAVWRALTGQQRVTPQLRDGLVSLLGEDHAAIVLAGIPERPRAHAPASPAVQKLLDLGGRSRDVALLVNADHSTVKRWLRGLARPSPRLAGALEQLVGAEAAAEILALIPDLRPAQRAAAAT
jgi:hypothetical protein